MTNAINLMIISFQFVLKFHDVLLMFALQFHYMLFLQSVNLEKDEK